MSREVSEWQRAVWRVEAASERLKRANQDLHDAEVESRLASEALDAIEASQPNLGAKP